MIKCQYFLLLQHRCVCIYFIYVDTLCVYVLNLRVLYQFCSIEGTVSDRVFGGFEKEFDESGVKPNDSTWEA